MADRDTPPQYDVATVEAVMLEVVAELHPERLSADGLSLRIVSDPDDDKEVGVALQAIHGLREFGLLKARDDGVVEPTPAALRAVALLT